MYEFCTEILKKQLDIGRAESTRQYEEETKAMIEGKKEETKGMMMGKKEKEVVIDDKLLYRPHGIYIA